MIAVEAKDVHKSYVIGKKVIPVLKGASLRVGGGETVAIVGKSGAGKSTLLHVLGALDPPDSGSVQIEQEDIYAASEQKRSDVRCLSLGFVFQSYHLLPEMDVSENVMLPAMARDVAGRSMADLRSQAMGLLETVGLAERASHTPAELSGGEQQRVALARALMNDPDIILADEPTGNLDKKTGAQVLDHMFTLVREADRTLVMVTHDLELAHTCDRTLLLRDGALKKE